MRGLTLIELLVALSVAAILAVIGIGGWQRWTHHQRLTLLQHEVVAAIKLARNTALTEQITVSLQGQPDWQHDLTLKTSGHLIQKVQISSHPCMLNWQGALNKPDIQFNSNGLSSHSNGRLTCCASAKCYWSIIINRLGRLNISRVGR